MITLTGKSISGLTRHGLSDYVLDDCRFDNCGVERPEKPGDRPVVRNVILRHCAQSACFLHAVAIEDVSLQDSLFDDVVLVAAKKSRKFGREMAVLHMLRKEGVAD